MIKYSIITPMYNSFDLMVNYFNSLINQTFKNFEVIIIDDFSNDGTYEKTKEFIKKLDLNVKLLRLEQNSGPGFARNIGINNAHGEWITFVDNDDWIDVNLLKSIDNITNLDSVNCIIYDYYTTNGSSKNRCHSMYKGNDGFVDVRECIKYVRNHSIGKFYRLSCIKGVEFPLLRRCEDVGFVCHAIAECKNIYYYKEPLYYYFQRNNSLSNNRKMDESDMISAFSYLEEKIGKEYPKELKEKSVTDLCYGVLLTMCKAKKKNKEIRYYLLNYNKKYPHWFKCEIIKSIGFAKRLFLTIAYIRQIWLLKVLASVHERMI